MNAPMLGLYGGADQSIPLSQIEAMRAAIKAAGKSSQIVVYPDTPHPSTPTIARAIGPRQPRMDGRECWSGLRKTASHEWQNDMNSRSPPTFETRF